MWLHSTPAGSIHSPKNTVISDVIRVALLSITLGYLFAYKVLSVNPVAPGRDRASPPQGKKETALYTCARRATFCICLWLMFSCTLHTCEKEMASCISCIHAVHKHTGEIDASFRCRFAAPGTDLTLFSFQTSTRRSGFAVDLCRCLMNCT